MNKIEHKKKIFIIDDDELASEALRIKLEDLGYEVFSAMNAEEGKKLFDMGEPDVLVIDYLLTGKNGIDVVESLKEKFPDIVGKTLLITSLENEAYLPRALDIGIKFHIKKNSSNASLVAEMVKNILS